MKQSKAISVTKKDIHQVYLHREYHRYSNHLFKGKLRLTNDVGIQYNCRRDNVSAYRDSRRVRQYYEPVRYCPSPKQIYLYHRDPSHTDIGVGSVKAFKKRKVKLIYLPNTSDRGVGSADLSSFIMRKQKNPRGVGYYDTKKTSSKCVGGTLVAADIAVSEKLSPIIQTKSGTTSPKISFAETPSNKEIRDIKIGSYFVEARAVATTTQGEMHETTHVDENLENSKDSKDSRDSKDINEISKVAKDSIELEKDFTKEIQKRIKKVIKAANYKENKKDSFSSDSLLEHVHNLEQPSDIGKLSDAMENKMEIEYRKIFASQSKNPAEKHERREYQKKVMQKSASQLRKRFTALRKSVAKKESIRIVRNKEEKVFPSVKDASITSDPPSLEERSFSSTRSDSIKKQPIARKLKYKKSFTGEKTSKILSKVKVIDSEYGQGVKGMFKLWGKKFNLDESNYKTENYSFHDRLHEKGEGDISELVDEIEDSISVEKILEKNSKKSGKKFFFFKKKTKEKEKAPPISKKEPITTGRCEIKDGLNIKVGGKTQPMILDKKLKKPKRENNNNLRTAWLMKYLSGQIDSKNSVKVRWSNRMYTTSSSTVFELMEDVYKGTGMIIRSRSELSTGGSSVYNRAYPRVNYLQTIQAFMVSKMIPTTSVRINNKSSNNIVATSSYKKNENKFIEVTISDRKWFIDKSKAFANNIEFSFHSNSFQNRNFSPECLKIDIPKYVFSQLGDEESFEINEEKVYKTIEYDSDFQSSLAESDISKPEDKYLSQDLEITISVQNDLGESTLYEKVIKRSQAHRDVITQGNDVYFPKICNVIGLGIVTQRHMSEMKPYLKITEYTSDEDYPHSHNFQRKSPERSESVMLCSHEYQKNCSNYVIDMFTVSDCHLQCCKKQNKLFNLSVTKSLPTFLGFNNRKTYKTKVRFIDEEEPNKEKTKKDECEQTECDDNNANYEISMVKNSIDVFKHRKIRAQEKKRWYIAHQVECKNSRIENYASDTTDSKSYRRNPDTLEDEQEIKLESTHETLHVGKTNGKGGTGSHKQLKLNPIPQNIGDLCTSLPNDNVCFEFKYVGSGHPLPEKNDNKPIDESVTSPNSTSQSCSSKNIVYLQSSQFSLLKHCKRYVVSEEARPSKDTGETEPVIKVEHPTCNVQKANGPPTVAINSEPQAVCLANHCKTDKNAFEDKTDRSCQVLMGHNELSRRSTTLEDKLIARYSYLNFENRNLEVFKSESVNRAESKLFEQKAHTKSALKSPNQCASFLRKKEPIYKIPNIQYESGIAVDNEVLLKIARDHDELMQAESILSRELCSKCRLLLEQGKQLSPSKTVPLLQQGDNFPLCKICNLPLQNENNSPILSSQVNSAIKKLTLSESPPEMQLFISNKSPVPEKGVTIIHGKRISTQLSTPNLLYGRNASCSVKDMMSSISSIDHSSIPGGIVSSSLLQVRLPNQYNNLPCSIRPSTVQNNTDNLSVNQQRNICDKCPDTVLQTQTGSFFHSEKQVSSFFGSSCDPKKSSNLCKVCRSPCTPKARCEDYCKICKSPCTPTLRCGERKLCKICKSPCTPQSRCGDVLPKLRSVGCSPVRSVTFSPPTTRSVHTSPRHSPPRSPQCRSSGFSPQRSFSQFQSIGCSPKISRGACQAQSRGCSPNVSRGACQTQSRGCSPKSSTSRGIFLTNTAACSPIRTRRCDNGNDVQTGFRSGYCPLCNKMRVGIKLSNMYQLPCEKIHSPPPNRKCVGSNTNKLLCSKCKLPMIPTFTSLSSSSGMKLVQSPEVSNYKQTSYDGAAPKLSSCSIKTSFHSGTSRFNPPCTLKRSRHRPPVPCNASHDSTPKVFPPCVMSTSCNSLMDTLCFHQTQTSQQSRPKQTQTPRHSCTSTPRSKKPRKKRARSEHYFTQTMLSPNKVHSNLESLCQSEPTTTVIPPKTKLRLPNYQQDDSNISFITSSNNFESSSNSSSSVVSAPCLVESKTVKCSGCFEKQSSKTKSKSVKISKCPICRENVSSGHYFILSQNEVKLSCKGKSDELLTQDFVVDDPSSTANECKTSSNYSSSNIYMQSESASNQKLEGYAENDSKKKVNTPHDLSKHPDFCQTGKGSSIDLFRRSQNESVQETRCKFEKVKNAYSSLKSSNIKGNTPQLHQATCKTCDLTLPCPTQSPPTVTYVPIPLPDSAKIEIIDPQLSNKIAPISRTSVLSNACILNESLENIQNIIKQSSQENNYFHLNGKLSSNLKDNYLIQNVNESVIDNLYQSSKTCADIMANKTSSVNRDNNISKMKSDSSVANVVEINFKLRVIQGDKTTEIKIDKDDIETPKMNSKRRDFEQKEVYVMNTNEEAQDKNSRNDLNIRIVIKNYKPKTNEDTNSIKEEVDEYANKISKKFNTVSTNSKNNTGNLYSDAVFSMHRSVVGLTKSSMKSDIFVVNSSVNLPAQSSCNCNCKSRKIELNTKSKSLGSMSTVQKTQSCDCNESPKNTTTLTTTKKTSKGNSNALGSNVTLKLSEQSSTSEWETRSSSNKPQSVCLTYESSIDLTNTENKSLKSDLLHKGEDITDKTLEKIELVPNKELIKDEKIKKVCNCKHKRFGCLDTDICNERDHCLTSGESKMSECQVDITINEQTSSSEKINVDLDSDTTEQSDFCLKKVNSINKKQEKKNKLKEMFENPKYFNEAKTKIGVEKLKNMLKEILTSDSEHESKEELVKDDDYLKKMMDNIYGPNNCCPHIADPLDHLKADRCCTSEKNKNTIDERKCICSTFAKKLNTTAGCCCRKKILKHDQSIDCKLKTEFSYDDFSFLIPSVECVEVQTKNSRYKGSSSSNQLSIIENKKFSEYGFGVEIDKTVSKVEDRLKINFSHLAPALENKNYIKNIRKISIDTKLGISDDDKVMYFKPESKSNLSRKYVFKAKKKKSSSRHSNESDVLQMYETKKAVLEIYAEKTVTENGERFVAKLPKFVRATESQLYESCEKLEHNNYVQRNFVMMCIRR